jgi:hypothetical protein
MAPVVAELRTAGVVGTGAAAAVGPGGDPRASGAPKAACAPQLNRLLAAQTGMVLPPNP